jgi:hypothetical protein
MEMKAASFFFAALTFISLIFRYEILYAKYVDLLDKLKEVKKSQFFSTVRDFWTLKKNFVEHRQRHLTDGIIVLTLSLVSTFFYLKFGKYFFHLQKNKVFAYSHVLWYFKNKFGVQKFRLSRSVAVRVLDEICIDAS